MKTRVVVLFAVLAAALAVAVAAQEGPAGNARPLVVPPGSTPTSELIALSAMVGDRVQQITIVDPRERSLAIYHIDLASGKAELKSVRKIHWDLQIEEFEGLAPLPQEVRSLVEQR